MNISSSPAEWLLESLELDVSLFHLGRYCGRWQASTNGLARASFHLVLEGRCWLHREDGRPGIELQQGDAVFLLRDDPYRLSSERKAQDAADSPRKAMHALRERQGEGVALVCGLFHFRPGLSHLVLQALPDYLILRGDREGVSAPHQLFALIRQECARGDMASGRLLERLSHLLFLYLLREQTLHGDTFGGLLKLARHPQFSELLGQLIEQPQRNWTLVDMAVLTGLSRSAFCKRVQELSGLTPGQVLLMLRIRQGCQLLQQNQSVADVAEAVGYQSVAAFTRAFSKVTGVLPGAYRRQYQ